MENKISVEKENPMPIDQVTNIYGHVDGVEAGMVSGWVINKLDIGSRCTVIAVNQGQVVSEAKADLYRDDLRAQGFGDGRHAFRLELPFLLDDTNIEILEKFTGAKLIGSPVKMGVATALSAAPRAHVLSESATEGLGEIAAGGDMKKQSSVVQETVSSLASTNPQGDKRISIKEPEKKKVSGPCLNHERFNHEIGSQLHNGQKRSATGGREPVDLVSAIHDVISKVRSRNNLQDKLSAPGEATISLAEVHRLPAADAVFFAYKAILGRAPDLKGYRTYVSALRSGAMSRTRLIEVLRCAPEAKHRHVRILHDVTERDLVGADRQSSTTRLLYSAEDFGINNLAGNEDADVFLPRAYRLVLKREPDPSGMAAYREAMGNGTTCAQVLTSMIGSDEFRQRGEPLVILGVTPGQDVIKTLFTATESMMTTIAELEYQLQTIKNT